MSNEWIRRLCEQVKEDIAKDDTPLHLVNSELYADYTPMHMTAKGVDLHYWLEDIVAKHEAK